MKVGRVRPEQMCGRKQHACRVLLCPACNVTGLWGQKKRLYEGQTQSGCTGPLRTRLRHVVTPIVAPNGSTSATLSHGINSRGRLIEDSRLEFNNARMGIGQRSHCQASTLETIHLAASKASDVTLELADAESHSHQ